MTRIRDMPVEGDMRLRIGPDGRNVSTRPRPRPQHHAELLGRGAFFDLNHEAALVGFARDPGDDLRDDGIWNQGPARLPMLAIAIVRSDLPPGTRRSLGAGRGDHYLLALAAVLLDDPRTT
jgi:hypothetical protein